MTTTIRIEVATDRASGDHPKKIVFEYKYDVYADNPRYWGSEMRTAINRACSRAVGTFGVDLSEHYNP